MPGSLVKVAGLFALSCPKGIADMNDIIARKKSFLEKITLFLLFLGVSFSICYWAIAKYDVYGDYKACGDARYYIQMSKLEYKDIPQPYRYRILGPSIVYLLNKYFKVEGFLSKYYEDVDKKMIQLNFGIVNIISLACTAFLLFYYCKNLGFSSYEGLIASFLFFTSFFVVNYYSTPILDSLSSFFMMAGFYAVLRGSIIGLGLSFLFGMLTKETTLTILLLIILEERKIISKKIIACLPGILVYWIVVQCVGTAPGFSFYRSLHSLEAFKGISLHSIRSFNFYFLIEHIQTFMFLWVLFLYALFKCKKPLFIKRALWLLLLMVIMIPITGTFAVGRVSFYLFPVVIPLALLTLRKILRAPEVTNREE